MATRWRRQARFNSQKALDGRPARATRSKRFQVSPISDRWRSVAVPSSGSDWTIQPEWFNVTTRSTDAHQAMKRCGFGSSDVELAASRMRLLPGLDIRH